MQTAARVTDLPTVLEPDGWVVNESNVPGSEHGASWWPTLGVAEGRARDLADSHPGLEIEYWPVYCLGPRTVQTVLVDAVEAGGEPEIADEGQPFAVSMDIASVLQSHHDWHLKNPDADLVEAYAESRLCEKTTEILAAIVGNGRSLDEVLAADLQRRLDNEATVVDNHNT